MKKEYSKPVLFAESFILREHIAENCGLEAGWSTHWDSAGSPPCGIRTNSTTEDDLILFSNTSVCTITEESMAEMGLSMADLEVVQYHGGTIPQFFSS